MGSGNPLGSIFGKSPFPPLQEHMRAVLECARDVRVLLQALADGDESAAIEARNRIFRTEAEADRIKDDIRGALPKSLFMPVDRRDLLDVLEMQDCIANTAQDIAGLMIERKMILPAFMRDQLLALGHRCVEACELCAGIIEELDELLETGFRGREAKRVEEMVGKLNLMEHETDTLGAELSRTLLAHEDELKPVTVIKWYQIIEWIGDLADFAEKAGDRLRLLIAR